jgi:penicillin-binding protein 1B
VGFDDNKELDLQGADSAAPIWTEFMKRALAYREYRDAKPFRAPDGIVSIDIDPQSGMPATPYCPVKRPEVYIVGTQPVGFCPLHGGGRQGVTNVAGWETTSPAKPASAADDSARAPGSEGEVSEAAVARRAARQNRANAAATAQSQPSPQQPRKEEKKGFFRRLLGVFK